MICHHVHDDDSLPGLVFATGYFYDKETGRTFNSGICKAKRLPETEPVREPESASDTPADLPRPSS